MALLPGGAAMSMAGGVREFATATPDAVAVIDGDRRLTYRALDDRSSRLAQSLLTGGLRPGDRVVVRLGNRLEFPEIICAAAKAGLVLVPVGTRSTAAEIQYILEHSGARGYLSDTEPPAHVDLVLHIAGPDSSYERALAAASGLDPRVPVAETDPCCLYYTSGTTGKPKGVLSSQRARTLMCYLSAMEWGLGAGRTSLAVAPMYHGAGMVFDYAPVLTGGTVVMLPKWDPEHLLALAERHRAQSVFLVPSHAQTLRALGGFGGRDLSSLDTLYFNAAALPATLKEWVRDAFPLAGVHELYGSTEAGVVTNCRPADRPVRPGSVGQPWFMTEVRVVDDAGHPVPAGERGELFSRSPFLMNGYLGDAAATGECTTDDGFLTSGDIVVRDEDGFIYVVDRKKDMIISGGVNVAPREVEDVILDFPGVAEAAVVGLADEQWGERVAAYVVTLPGAKVDPAELEAHCRSRLSGPKLPRTVEFRAALPRNAAGKVLKRELRAP